MLEPEPSSFSLKALSFCAGSFILVVVSDLCWMDHLHELMVSHGIFDIPKSSLGIKGLILSPSSPTSSPSPFLNSRYGVSRGISRNWCEPSARPVPRIFLPT